MNPVLTVIEEEFVTAVILLSSPLILIISPAVYCRSNAVVAASLAVAVVAVTVATFAETATVPNIFLDGSENGDLFLRTAVPLEIAPVTGSLWTVHAVLLAIAEIMKVLAPTAIESPTLSSVPNFEFVAVIAPVEA